MTEQEVVDFVNRCHDKETKEGSASLTDFEKTITLVSSINFEIALGGFLGFFCNSAGDKARETVTALTSIGAAAAAEAVQAAIYSLPDQLRVPEREYRQDNLQSLIDSPLPIEAIYEAQDPCIWDLLIAYVIRHESGSGSTVPMVAPVRRDS